MNKVTICGRTCQDMKVNGKEGKKFVTNSIAINMGKDKTEFVNIIAFGKVAETLYKFVKKGDMVLIDGSIHTSKSGDRYYTSILVHMIDLLPNERKEKKDFKDEGLQF